MRILMSMFGWNDSGGGTIFPRLIALELQQRGHDVMVVYSAVPQIAGAPQYQIREHEEKGVKLVGIHNRPAPFLDDQNPQREHNNPRTVEIFEYYFNKFQPDIVHYHNFLGLSLCIVDIAYQKQIASFYTPYNFWLLCPTLYLNLPNLSLCQGVNASGQNCLSCTRSSRSGADYVTRRNLLRQTFQEKVGPCLASSECVKDLLLENGYRDNQVEILKFANERSEKIWAEAGSTRQASVPETLKIGFTGSIIPIKGVHTLVQAAQLLQGSIEILIYGKAPDEYLAYLKSLDGLNRVQFKGFFANEDHSQILSELSLAVVPSVCYDHSPLVIGEFLAARTPVIGANIGGIPDYIPEGCGELFEAGNATDLARVLQKYIDAPEQIKTLQEKIEAPLSFGDYVSDLEQRYKKADSENRFLNRKYYNVWTSRRGRTALYHAQTLAPLNKEQINADNNLPYGIDLWPTQIDLEESFIEKADWIMSPVLEKNQQEQLEHTYKKKYFLAPLERNSELLESEDFLMDLGSEYKHKYLLPMATQCNDFNKILESYMLSPVDHNTILIIVPWKQNFELAEQYVIESLSHLAETEHELTLLELPNSPKSLQKLITEVSCLILPESLKSDTLLNGYSTLCEQIAVHYSISLDKNWSEVKPQKNHFLSNYTRWENTKKEAKNSNDSLPRVREFIDMISKK